MLRTQRFQVNIHVTIDTPESENETWLHELMQQFQTQVEDFKGAKVKLVNIQAPNYLYLPTRYESGGIHPKPLPRSSDRSHEPRRHCKYCVNT